MDKRLLLLVAVAAAVAVVPGAWAQTPTKVYVPDFTGDVTAGLAEVMASEVSTALSKRGIQALTNANLADQLNEEERKEALQCGIESSCIEEVVASFGYADRIFGRVRKLGRRDYHIELSYARKSRIVRKETEQVTCDARELAAVAAKMALVVAGLSSVPVPPVDPVQPDPDQPIALPEPGKEYVVEFGSQPSGAQVEIDGVPRKVTPCSMYLAEGAHKVRMTLLRHQPQEEMIVFRKDRSIQWELKPLFGWLTIDSQPSGLPARVSRQGRRESQSVTTPSAKLELDPGTYRIEIVHDTWYPAAKNVVVKAARAETVTLKPKAKQGYLKVKAFDDKGNAVRAEVHAGGNKLGRAPGPWLLNVGSYEIEVKAKDHSDAKQTAVVELNKTRSIRVELKKGALASGDTVRIPAGKFWMGCNSRVDKKCEADEKPYHEVYVNEYYIDRHEVTFGEHAKCVRAGKCEASHVYDGECWVYNDSKWEQGELPRTFLGDAHPVVCVDWHQADAYCRWADKRLPTEAEWEKAARGTAGRKFPWGNDDATCSRAVMHDGGHGCGKQRTWPVCSKPKGNSPYGLCDMAGNVWEWVADWYDSGYYKSSPSRNPAGPSSGSSRVLRGGSRSVNERNLRASSRLGNPPDSTVDYFGFRCVSSSQ